MGPVAPQLEVALDAGRPGWAVLSLRGAFGGREQLWALAELLLELLTTGVVVVSVDARGVDVLGEEACRLLAETGTLLRDEDGHLVVTVASAAAARALRTHDGVRPGDVLSA